MFGRKEKTGQEKKKRVRIHEATLENDIRYRGPLSFQHFQILGWLCIAISQLAVIFALGGRIDEQIAADTATWQTILSNVANLSLPFLLIANFAQILDTENGYRKQLVKNAAAMLAICGLYYAVFYHYIVGGVGAFLEDPGQALPAVESAIDMAAESGFLAFNLFVDLFLCTLTMFFLNYKPRRVFAGKARFLFRLMGLLPIAYEVGCMVLKVRAAKGLIEVPVWAFPLLTVKPPMTFVLFVALALFVKTRELRFRRHGKTHEEYKAFLKTRRNSWNFSVFLAVMLVIVSLVDFAVVIGFSLDEVVHTALESTQQTVKNETAAPGGIAPELPSPDEAAPETIAPDEAAPEAIAPELTAPGEAAQSEALSEAAAPDEAPADGPREDMTDEERIEAALNDVGQGGVLDAAAEKGMRVGIAVGFGGSIYLILLTPVVLLFSYTRKPKYPWLGLLVPVAGICLILLVYLEGVHQLLYRLPIPKMNLDDLAEMATDYVELLQ